MQWCHLHLRRHLSFAHCLLHLLMRHQWATAVDNGVNYLLLASFWLECHLMLYWLLLLLLQLIVMLLLGQFLLYLELLVRLLLLGVRASAISSLRRIWHCIVWHVLSGVLCGLNWTSNSIWLLVIGVTLIFRDVWISCRGTIQQAWWRSHYTNAPIYTSIIVLYSLLIRSQLSLSSYICVHLRTLIWLISGVTLALPLFLTRGYIIDLRNLLLHILNNFGTNLIINIL